jgi:tetratricopeptide (TPR) repeat protein
VVRDPRRPGQDAARVHLIWLSQRYELAAYAYATRVALQKAPDRDAVESLDIYASSSDKDVVASYSISRHPNGSISFARASYSSEPAKDHSDQIFLGLHRSGGAASSVRGEEFEKVWATLESKVYWRGVNTKAGAAPGDEAAALISRALQLHASGNCEEALPLGEKAADLLRKRNETQSENFAWALVAQALCHKRLVRVAEAERLYRQAIEIHEKVAGANSRDLAITLDNLAALYAEHGRLAEAEQLRLRALQIFKAVLDPANPHIATALQNLAVLHQYQGRLSEALERYLEALPIAEKA